MQKGERNKKKDQANEQEEGRKVIVDTTTS